MSGYVISNNAQIQVVSTRVFCCTYRCTRIVYTRSNRSSPFERTTTVTLICTPSRIRQQHPLDECSRETFTAFRSDTNSFSPHLLTIDDTHLLLDISCSACFPPTLTCDWKGMVLAILDLQALTVCHNLMTAFAQAPHQIA